MNLLKNSINSNIMFYCPKIIGVHGIPIGVEDTQNP